VVKSAQALFLAEVLYKLIREEESNPGIYAFLENPFLFLDNMVKGTANFHLWFLVHLTEWAGIYPLLEEVKSGWFDLKRGSICQSEPLHPYYMDRETTALLCEIAGMSIGVAGNLTLNHTARNQLTGKLLEYYHLHFENMGNFRSLAVLQEVFQ